MSFCSFVKKTQSKTYYYYLHAIEKLLQNKCTITREFLSINAKSSSWTEKCA